MYNPSCEDNDDSSRLKLSLFRPLRISPLGRAIYSWITVHKLDRGHIIEA